MTNKIEEQYNIHYNTPSDINEHLPVLKKYASECDIIYELGVRTVVSTWGLLAGYPKKLVSVDIVHPDKQGKNTLSLVYEASEEEDIDFSLILEDTLQLEIEETDLLFIDTLHTYIQLKQELALHAKNTKKYIIMHDTVTFGNFLFHLGEGGLNKAINEFLKDNPEWEVEEVCTNNNGLTVLKRHG